MATVPSETPDLETRRQLMLETLQKKEGCYYEVPEPMVTPPQEQWNLAMAAEADRPTLTGDLEILVSGLNKPVIIDRFNDDDASRTEWAERMEKEYGSVFANFYNSGKLNYNTIRNTLAVINDLLRLRTQTNTHTGQRLELAVVEELSRKLEGERSSGTTPPYMVYAQLSTAERMQMAIEIDQLTRQTLQELMTLPEQQRIISQKAEQTAEITSYLQELTPYEVGQALEIRQKLNQLGLFIGPNCMDGWKWFPNTWPSKDPEGMGRDILRMILDASYRFLPKELQEWFHENWCFNPVRLDGAEVGLGPPNKNLLSRNSDKQIILGLIASNAFDFHVELASYTLTPPEKEEFIQYWLKLKELVTNLGIKPSQITDHLGFLDSKNLKQALEAQQPYNFEQVLLSGSPEKAQLALGQAREQIERLQARGSKYLTIHGTPLLTPLEPEGFLNLKNRLQALVQFAESHNVHICLEIQGETKEQIDALLKDIPQLKITWDIAHIYLQDQTFNKSNQPQTHMSNENFFDYLAKGRVGMLHLGQPTLVPDETGSKVPQDSHHPLFSSEGLIPQDFLKRMFKAVQKYNQSGSLDKIHAIFESPLKLNDYDTILKMIEPS